MVDRMRDEIPERYWVFRAFSHYDALDPDRANPTVIRCGICDKVLIRAEEKEADNMPLLMYEDEPICPKDAIPKISSHPLTASYLKWMEEGDPRWWSQWFCDCDGCQLSLLGAGDEPSSGSGK